VGVPGPLPGHSQGQLHPGVHAVGLQGPWPGGGWTWNPLPVGGAWVGAGGEERPGVRGNSMPEGHSPSCHGNGLPAGGGPGNSCAPTTRDGRPLAGPGGATVGPRIHGGLAGVGEVGGVPVQGAG
jgi:hypothetical protein